MLTWLPNQISTVIVPYVKCPCLPDKSSTVQWEICIQLIYDNIGYGVLKAKEYYMILFYFAFQKVDIMIYFMRSSRNHQMFTE